MLKSVFNLDQCLTLPTSKMWGRFFAQKLQRQMSVAAETHTNSVNNFSSVFTNNLSGMLLLVQTLL